MKPPSWAKSVGGFVMASGRRPAASGQPRRTNLIDDVMAFIRQYMVMSEDQLLVVAVWAIHTHLIEVFDQTPYLADTSPDPRCGKTRLLEVLELIVAKPWRTAIPSEAVLYRTIHERRPTLLLDEVDTIFRPQVADHYEGHRALINAGSRRGVTVPRCVGPSSKVLDFRVYCAKALAGIGTMPETIADRSIPIRLARKRKDEKVKRFYWRDASVGYALRDRVKAWADKHAPDFVGIEVEMPEELNDRMQEGCECLVAIADALHRGEKLRQALVALLTEERLDDRESMRLRLLRDLKAIFEERGMPTGITTETLLDALRKIEEAPWRNYYGRGFDARDIAKLLGPYDIGPTTIWLGRRSTANAAKGYKRDDLYEAWERYL